MSLSVRRTCRRVIAAAALLSPTAAVVGAQETADDFSFVVLGHLRGPTEGALNPLVDELVADIQALKPDLVFLTGDLIHGHKGRLEADPAVVRQDWVDLDSRLAEIGVPIHRVPGNHDISVPVTRDIYFERYEPLPRLIRRGRTIFLLVNSAAVPAGNNQAPYEFFRGKPLDSVQINFVLAQLSNLDDYDHAFVVMHHLLYWSEDAPWWSNVHPLLVGRNVRAVFSGELGPLKFSHFRRDGIDYIQSAISTGETVERMRRTREAGAPVVSFMHDTFLHVTVRGPEVDVAVRPVGALAGDRFSPERFRAVYGDIGHRPPKRPPPPGRARRIINRLAPFGRPAATVLVLVAVFLSGLAAAALWRRVRSPTV